MEDESATVWGGKDRELEVGSYSEGNEPRVNQSVFEATYSSSFCFRPFGSSYCEVEQQSFRRLESASSTHSAIFHSFIRPSLPAYAHAAVPSTSQAPHSESVEHTTTSPLLSASPTTLETRPRIRIDKTRLEEDDVAALVASAATQAVQLGR